MKYYITNKSDQKRRGNYEMSQRRRMKTFLYPNIPVKSQIIEIESNLIASFYIIQYI